MPEVADQFRYHKVKCLDQAKEWTNKYARNNQGGLVVDSQKRKFPEDQGAAKKSRH